MITGGFTAEKAKEILTHYPKFVRALKGFLLGVGELPQEWEKIIPKEVFGSTDNLVTIMLTSSSYRDLYDFFDQKKIICSITDVKQNEDIVFVGTIDDIEVNEKGILYHSSRVDCELAMFEKAIKQYEQLQGRR